MLKEGKTISRCDDKADAGSGLTEKTVSPYLSKVSKAGLGMLTRVSQYSRLPDEYIVMRQVQGEGREEVESVLGSGSVECLARMDLTAAWL